MNEPLSNSSNRPSAPATSLPSRGWGKLAIGLLFGGAVVVAMVLFRDKLLLQYLAGQESLFRDFKADHPVVVYGLAFALYVAVTGLSIPGAAGLTIAFGWLFDWWQAIVLVSFASTTGATLAFLISRYLFRDALQAKFGDRLAKFNAALEKEGAFYLFTLRLVVGVPFFVINVVMGLTPIKTSTFWWVSQVGMLAGTMLYTYVGNAVPDLQTLADQGVQAVFTKSQIVQFLIAFGLLGVFPLLTKWGIAKLRPQGSPAS